MALTATVNRIRGVLEREFADHIDMTDWKSRPPEHVEGAFLSRALAAQCIKSFAGADPGAAASALVDGLDDGGIDAIYFDAPTDTMFVVQSKWSGSGNSSFDEGVISKFVNGVKRILGADFRHFNAKVQAKAPEIREVLYSDRAVRIRLLTVHTAKQPLGPHVLRVIENFVRELNDPVVIADHVDIDQSGVYDLITAESRDAKIRLQAVLNDWGVIERPYLAYYGRVSADQIIEWWREHSNKLFSQNLRLYYQNSTVNDALSRTLSEGPENFWYFNNGITIIADRVAKGLAGAPAHKFANFTCEGASVVNGAQTVGTIGSSADAIGSASGSTEDLPTWIQVRLISLEGCPPDFGRRITRAANLQNAVGTREFAAMDPLQHRLAVEFALDKRRYVYKSGETDPKGDEGCSIVEATQALACAHSVRLAVEVKREIGSIWADTDAAPYTQVFPPDLSAERVWKAVGVMRITDEAIQVLRFSPAPRADLVGTHMARIILHLVFQDPHVRQGYRSAGPFENAVEAIKACISGIFDRVADYIERNHPNDYLANFSKNSMKCEALAANLNKPPQAQDHQTSLLDLLK
ncbi:AIPR family protein [Bradyrhizobium sp. 144]|uniref:AIPR family protein n=1 Tax=Bradyrhizobium sp. 144 TaxID=2782620 RepID=UPI001FF8A3C5|nr:AIPR family protein [Bradyrhizobium sp. 144]MCK1694580.1 AIPR family protein [Bradyrhizobium sp. 144]